MAVYINIYVKLLLYTGGGGGFEPRFEPPVHVLARTTV